MRRTRGSAAADTIAHFDRIADHYRAEYEAETPAGLAFRMRRQVVLDLLGSGPGTVLDVGCGPGVMVEPLLSRGWTFWGIDPAPAMIAACTAGPNVHLAVGSAERLAFSDEQFDAVICMGVIERISDDTSALREMLRVLKPGGILIVTAPHRFSPSLAWRNLIVYPVVGALRPLYSRLAGARSAAVIRGHRSYSRKSLGRLLESAGAIVTDTQYCVITLPAPIPALLPRAAMRIMRWAEATLRNPVRGLGTAVVVRAHKCEQTS